MIGKDLRIANNERSPFPFKQHVTVLQCRWVQGEYLLWNASDIVSRHSPSASCAAERFEQ